VIIAAATVVGAIWPDTAVKMKPLGDGFIKLIGLLIAPIVFCIIVSEISGMGSAGRVARLSVKTMVYFYVVSALALLLGLIAANLIPTGVGLNIDPRSIDASSIVLPLLKLILVFYGAWRLCSLRWCQSPGTSVSAYSNSAATSSVRY